MFKQALKNKYCSFTYFNELLYVCVTAPSVKSRDDAIRMASKQLTKELLGNEGTCATVMLVLLVVAVAGVSFMYIKSLSSLY